MRLLIYTQKVDKNDPVLGFFHQWIEEFAEHLDALEVVCLEKGEYTLPGNARVTSLGREEGKGRMTYVWRFYKHLFGGRSAYDAVFVHMNAEYVLLGGIFWHLWGKSVGLWYTHKKVSWKLRVAHMLTDIVFTASEESFRMPSKKLSVMGHGIDFSHFQPASRSNDENGKKTVTLISAGRISEIKRTDLLIEVARVLRERGVSYSLSLAGVPISGLDRVYQDELQRRIHEWKLEERVHFVGAKTYQEMPAFYRSGDIFLHASETGSLDKVVLEALACGLPVLTTSDAYPFLPEKYRVAGDAESIADRIMEIRGSSVSDEVREEIRTRHDVEALITRIQEAYKKS